MRTYYVFDNSHQQAVKRIEPRVKATQAQLARLSDAALPAPLVAPCYGLLRAQRFCGSAGSKDVGPATLSLVHAGISASMHVIAALAGVTE